MLSPIIAVQKKSRPQSNTKGNGTRAQPAATQKSKEDAPKPVLPVKRTPAQTAEVVKIRKENLLRYMATWAYRLNMERANGADSDSATSPSETEFAKVLDISKSYLSLIKSGGKQIHDKLAAQFERRLGMAPGELDREVAATSNETVSGKQYPQSAQNLNNDLMKEFAQFAQFAQSAWSRLTQAERTQLQRLMFQPELIELVEKLKLKLSNADNTGSTMKEPHAQPSQRFKG